MSRIGQRLLSIANAAALTLCACRQAAPSSPNEVGSAVDQLDRVQAMRSSGANDAWNQLRRALLLRTDPEGKELGLAELDPLLWPESSYLLRSPRYEEIDSRLTQVLRVDGSTLQRDTLRRAILQRDLWAIFDWLVQVDKEEQAQLTGHDFPKGRAMHMAVRLSQLMQQLALSDVEISSLPDVYAAALSSKSWPLEPSESSGAPPDEPFLPADLFDPTGAWILLGSDFYSVTPLHDAHFQGRSVFSVHLRLPGGRAEGLEYLRRLREFPAPLIRHEPESGEHARPLEALYLNPQTPQFPVGTLVALVRRAILFDVEGRLHTTRLVESVQIRRFRSIGTTKPGEFFDYPRAGQQLAELVLDRDKLFAGESGGLRAVASDEHAFPQFLTFSWDPLVPPGDGPPRRRFDTCMECHGAAGIFSVQTYTRVNAGMGSQLNAPVDTVRRLKESNPEVVEYVALEFAASRYEWGVLRGLWANAK